MKTIEQQVDYKKLNEERAVRKFCNGIAMQLPPSNEVMEAIRLLNKELPAFAQERDRVAREEEREKNLKGNFSEIDYIQAICYALIKRCSETNATTMSINQDGVTFAGEPIGDWKITVEALTTPHEND